MKSCKRKRKIFVVDTNVLMHSPGSILSFADNLVIIPITVIEELDKHKSRNDEVGRNTRQVVRILDNLRAKGSLSAGVETDSGGIIRIEMNNKDAFGENIPLGLDLSVPDNRILAVAYNQNQAEQKKGIHGEEVWVVTKDINMRLKADAIGLMTDDWNKDRVDIDSLYSGWREIFIDSEVLNDFYQQKRVCIDGSFFPNEFAHFVCRDNNKKTGIARFDDGQKCFVALNDGYGSAHGLPHANMEQRFALELLLDSKIELVSLVGQAGTGKTLLALAAGLQMSLDDQYEKILVTRPIMPMGQDIGYLPGSKDEKLAIWMQPIYDNLEFLLSRESRKKNRKLAINVPAEYAQGVYGENVDNYIGDDKIISLEAITYIRGRSIPKRFIIVDEAQNLTPHEIKTIISRVGEGTKIILTGDPTQIDHPYLDSESNGLTCAVEKLKNFPTIGHITLTRTKRSNLASIAAENL